MDPIPSHPILFARTSPTGVTATRVPPAAQRIASPSFHKKNPDEYLRSFAMIPLRDCRFSDA